MTRRAARALPLPLLLLLVLLTSPASASASTARWTELTTRTAPSPRGDAGLAAADRGAAYLFGGERSGRGLGDLWKLDLKAERWRRVSPAGARPPARFGHDLVDAGDGTLLLFGGQDGNHFFDDTWRYDPAKNAWSQIAADGPAARYGEGGAYDPATRTLYVTHGFTTHGRFDDTWALSGGTWTELSPPAGVERPLRRCLVGAAYRRGGVFLFGGQSDSKPFLGDLWRFDVAARQWTELKPARAPSARNLYGSAQLGSTWLIHGGNGRSGPLGDLWALDLDGNSFARVRADGKKPSPRFSEAMTPLDSKRALLFGGNGDDGGLADTWVLKLAR